MQPALDGWKRSLRGEAPASPLASNAARDDEGALLSKMRIAAGAVSLVTFKQGFRETASANGAAERREFGANGP
jgi:hypothetical protein